MELAENSVVAGRFRLNRLLAVGGMGSVWHATHLGLDIPCAVKFIDASATSDLNSAQARFTREARAAAQLRSPHVVQILDHGVWEGTPYIAMELLEGEDLGKRLARVGHLLPGELHSIVSQVCRALTKAHALGIVHRDLKPDNIFIVRDDDREIVKVLDFGIAKQQIAELSGSKTKTGALLGTPQYMSPEQAKGARNVDGRSDLWSLAVIAFEALTGQVPFMGEALGELILKIVIEDLPVPSGSAPVPPGFDAWWRKAVARDPAERFQTAREFSDSLAIVCGATVDGDRSGPLPSLPSSAASAVSSGPTTERTPSFEIPQQSAAATPVPLAQTLGGAAPPGPIEERRGPPVALLAASGVLALAALGAFAFFFVSGARSSNASVAPTEFGAPAPPASVPVSSPAPPPAPPPGGPAPAVIPDAKSHGAQPATPATGTAPLPPLPHAAQPVTPAAPPPVAAPARPVGPKKPAGAHSSPDMGF